MYSGETDNELTEVSSVIFKNQVRNLKNTFKIIDSAIKMLGSGTKGERQGFNTLLRHIEFFDIDDLRRFVIHFKEGMICKHNLPANEVSPVRIILPKFSVHIPSEELPHMLNISNNSEDLYLHVHASESSNESSEFTFKYSNDHSSWYCAGMHKYDIFDAVRNRDFLMLLITIIDSVTKYSPFDEFAEHGMKMIHRIHPDDAKYLTRCEYCNETLWKGLYHECEDENMGYCARCEERVHIDNLYIGLDDQDYCEHCFYELFYRCEICGETCFSDEMYRVYTYHESHCEYVETEVCENCLSEYTECEECYELLNKVIEYSDSHKVVCLTCAVENQCSVCEEYYEDIQVDRDGMPICHNCLEEKTNSNQTEEE